MFYKQGFSVFFSGRCTYDHLFYIYNDLCEFIHLVRNWTFYTFLNWTIMELTTCYKPRFYWGSGKDEQWRSYMETRPVPNSKHSITSNATVLVGFQGHLVLESSGHNCQSCKWLWQVSRNHVTPWLHEWHCDVRESYLRWIMWVVSCLCCPCQPGQGVGRLSVCLILVGPGGHQSSWADHIGQRQDVRR